VADVDPELSGARSRQHVHEREAFDELLLFDPPALLLDLCLHNAHDGGPAIAHSADLQKNPRDLSSTDALCAHVESLMQAMRQSLFNPTIVFVPSMFSTVISTASPLRTESKIRPS
jgi:hypothetical protein